MITTIVSAFLLVLILFVGFAYFILNARIKREVSDLFSAGLTSPKIVTEEMIAALPPPVQRYMAYSGMLGKTIPRTVRLRQVGRIRQDEKSAWMKLEAVEWYSTTPPGFVWKVFVPNRRFPLALGRDAYLDGRGSLLVKMLSLFPMAKAAGSEIDQASMMRYLNEMVWFPAAFLGPNIAWKAIDGGSAEVALTDRGKTVSAVMLFDSDGKVLNFFAKRYMLAGKKSLLENWSTPYTGYGEFEGLRLPVRGQAVYNLKQSDLVYAEFEITELEYR